jgi:hypothetical protein
VYWFIICICFEALLAAMNTPQSQWPYTYAKSQSWGQAVVEKVPRLSCIWCLFFTDVACASPCISCSCLTDVESSSPYLCCCLTCACRSSTAQTRGSTCCTADPARRALRRLCRWVAGWRSDDLQTYCVITDVALVFPRISWNVYVLRMWNLPLRVLLLPHMRLSIFDCPNPRAHMFQSKARSTRAPPLQLMGTRLA